MSLLLSLSEYICQIIHKVLLQKKLIAFSKRSIFSQVIKEEIEAIGNALSKVFEASYAKLLI